MLECCINNLKNFFPLPARNNDFWSFASNAERENSIRSSREWFNQAFLIFFFKLTIILPLSSCWQRAKDVKILLCCLTRRYRWKVDRWEVFIRLRWNIKVKLAGCSKFACAQQWLCIMFLRTFLNLLMLEIICLQYLNILANALPKTLTLVKRQHPLCTHHWLLKKNKIFPKHLWLRPGMLHRLKIASLHAFDWAWETNVPWSFHL